jgi:hypothetical protein
MQRGETRTAHQHLYPELQSEGDSHPHLGARSLYFANSDLGSGAGAKISAIPRCPSPEGVYEEDSVGICLDGAISVCLIEVVWIVVGVNDNYVDVDISSLYGVPRPTATHRNTGTKWR